VHSERLDAFTKKIKQYGDPSQRTSKGKPKNELLVACISSIQAPVLSDFWTGPSNALPSGPEKFFWEVWVSKLVGADKLRNHAHRLDIIIFQQTLSFPDREVVLARGTVPEL